MYLLCKYISVFVYTTKSRTRAFSGDMTERVPPSLRSSYPFGVCRVADIELMAPTQSIGEVGCGESCGKGRNRTAGMRCHVVRGGRGGWGERKRFGHQSI